MNKWLVKMINGDQYMVITPIDNVNEFINQIFGKDKRYQISVWKIANPKQNRDGVILLGDTISSIEFVGE